MLRLTCHANATEVANALQYSPALTACRKLVIDAGCELRPAWSNGAWLLLPLTRKLLEEAGLQTTDIHVLALGRDEEHVREALKSVQYEKRPKIRPAQVLDKTSWCAAVGSSSDEPVDPFDLPTLSEDDGFDIVVKCTFLEIKPRTLHKSGPQSAP